VGIVKICTVREIAVAFVKLPDVPVIVTVTVPVAAVLPAVSVIVLVLAVLLGLNDAVTPLGSPEADKLTLPLKPFCGVTVIVLVPLPPCRIVTLLGDAESVKFGTGTGFTVRESVVVFVKLPEEPRTRTESVPIDAVLLADRVSVLLPVVLLGLNEAVTPRGSPEADKLTLPVKPPCGVTVIVDVTLPPRTRVKELGEAEREKLGGAVTVRETAVVCDKAPDVPVIVMVTVPRAAALLAVKVSVLVVVALAGLNAAVTPLGSPDAERLTLVLKPLSGLTVIVLVPLVPWMRMRLIGEAERVKSPGGFTTSAIEVLLLRLPEVPVTVTVKVPIVALAEADSVKRLVVVAGFVPKTAVTPLGSPEAVRVTLPLNPFRRLIVTAAEPVPLWRKVKLVGDAESVKPGCVEEEGQLLTKLAALTVPMPVAKSQPTLVPYAGANDVLEGESTPTEAHRPSSSSGPGNQRPCHLRSRRRKCSCSQPCCRCSSYTRCCRSNHIRRQRVGSRRGRDCPAAHQPSG